MTRLSIKTSTTHCAHSASMSNCPLAAHYSNDFPCALATLGLDFVAGMVLVQAGLSSRS
jgi:hypothetical protein